MGMVIVLGGRDDFIFGLFFVKQMNNYINKCMKLISKSFNLK